MMLNLSLKSQKLRYRYKTEPYSHQKRALAKIQKLNGQCALFMEMGTGKTKVAIDWAGIGFYNYGTKKVLIVAPLSVLGVWPRQIRQHSDVPSRIYRLSGNTNTRVRYLTSILRAPDESKLTYVLINYEGIWRSPRSGPGVEALIRKWAPDLVIFDESHRIKSPTAKQSKAAWRIARESSQRLLLTGTPITKAPLDVFGQFRALNHSIFGENWYQFKFTFGIWGGFGKYQLLRYRNLDILIQKVREWSFRIKKTQCLDLPEKLFQDVPVTLSDRALKLYKQMSEQAIIEIEETHATATIVLTKILRLQQITSGFIKDVDGNIRIFDNSKLEVFKDLLDDVLAEDQKVVVFFRFIPDLRRVEEHLLNKGIPHRILSGSVPDSQRDSIVEDFQTNPKVKVFLAQVQAGSEGIELFSASVAIYYSMSNSLLHWQQSQDRLHRPGQTKNVTYYRLIAPRTVDSLTYKALDEKKKIADIVIHDPFVLRH
jgi:SNF2 family DNA or RNA helicase